MTPETTNARSYKLTDVRIRRVTTEQISSPSNGESVKDAASKILRYPLPEWYSMDAAYGETARRLNQPAEANELATDLWPEGESVEDFIAAATEGRYEEEEDEPDS